jgi:hypothetical protein
LDGSVRPAWRVTIHLSFYCMARRKSNSIRAKRLLQYFYGNCAT